MKMPPSSADPHAALGVLPQRLHRHLRHCATCRRPARADRPSSGRAQRSGRSRRCSVPWSCRSRSAPGDRDRSGRPPNALRPSLTLKLREDGLAEAAQALVRRQPRRAFAIPVDAEDGGVEQAALSAPRVQRAVLVLQQSRCPWSIRRRWRTRRCRRPFPRTSGRWSAAGPRLRSKCCDASAAEAMHGVLADPEVAAAVGERVHAKARICRARVG